MADAELVVEEDIPDADRAEDIQAFISAAVADAVDYIDEEVAPDREEALRYYRGEPFGDEEQGRSQYVSRDVHDTIKALLPSLLRTFFGSENVVEFMPQGPEDTDAAAQATDYVNWIVTQDNPGFLVIHSALKDALIQRTGIIKYWWDEAETVEAEKYTGVSELTAAMLAQDEDLEIREAVPREGDNGELLLDLSVARRSEVGRAKIMAVPPEEFIIDRGARSIDSAMIVGHRTDKTLSDLVAMGFDSDEIEEHLGTDVLATNAERLEREGERVHDVESFGEESQRTALYTEVWARADRDGDGIAELRKYCTIGPNYKILFSEPATEAPFADFTPDPEPHRFIGSSSADQVMDLQRLKSSIVRKMNDSLAQSIHPRAGVVEGQVNMDDALNNETGALIRMRQAGAYQPFATPFVGQQAFPVLEYLDHVKESRTGIKEATQGLNGEQMQSSTRLAVQATVEAAQQQLELVARVFAETGFRRLYRGLLGVVQRNQDRARVIRLRGTWVEIDPRSWNSGMDVQVNTALGTGTSDEKLGRLASIEQMQRGILTELGPRNPLVTMGQYSHTLRKMSELAGFKDPSQFFNEIPLDFQPPEPEPQPTPEQMLAEVQREEIRANIEKKAAELEIEREKVAMDNQRAREKTKLDDDRVRDKNETDMMLRAAEIEAKHGVEVNIEDLLNVINRPRGNV